MTAILQAALIYAGAVQREMRIAQAAYAADEDCPMAQINLKMIARALERSDVMLANAYAIDKWVQTN